MLGYEYVLHNASTLTREGYVLKNQAIVIQEGKIAWCGDECLLPRAFDDAARVMDDCHGRLITPGLIDCHTHLVYAGNRALEYQKRLSGVSYLDIAQAGGGILDTVLKTRSCSYDALIEQSLPRLQAMRAQGVTTVEIKSGYGLDQETELKMLRVAKTLGQLTGLRVMTTFLGAHTIAPEYRERPDAYIDLLCQDVLPAMASEGLIDAVDVFCERIAFNLAQTEKIFECAQSLGLRVKCHAEQLSLMGAAKLAASFNALSCDHLEYLDPEGIEAMKASHTVAVLLPGAYYFLAESQKPPIEVLRQAGLGMAIATDCNPGTSPTTSLPLMMQMSCRFYGLSIEEAWMAVTYQAARALGIEQERGEIAIGKVADLVRWETESTADLCYYFGHTVPHDLMIAGLWT